MIHSIMHNRYQIIQKLGEGGMGIVYHAYDLQHDNAPVAIKALKQNSVAHRLKDILRFKNEAIVASGLKHPHIIKIHEIFEAPDGPCIVMDYCAGGNLAGYIDKNGLAIETTLLIVRQIARALNHVHSAGIIHRDLKPANILLTEKPAGSTPDMRTHIRIIDFGLALIRDLFRLDGPSPFVPASVIGTFGYMSPEQIQPVHKTVDERSDLYSLGIIMYQLTTGRLPFDGEEAGSVIHQHLAKLPKPPRDYRPDLPPVLEKIILHLMQKDPSLRYQSAQGLINDIAKFQAGDTDFEPGFDDRITRINYKTGFIGREDEIAALIRRYEAAQKGNGSICLVSGEAGTGKTRLAHELRQQVFGSHGVFISGKCFFGDNKTPYGPFADALNIYMRYFNNYPEIKRARIKKTVRDAAGSLGAIIANLNPLLREIIGETADLIPLEPDREKGRFLLTACRFLQRLAAAEGGMVLLLEDLQWADEGSLALIFELLHDIHEIPLLLVGTYRTTGVGYRHTLKKIMINAKEKGRPLSKIELMPFTRAWMDRYLAEIFHKHEGDEALRRISDFIQTKSRGNPFFARELVRQLMSSQAIRYDAKNRLLIDENLIRSIEIPATIVDILITQISLFDDNERMILSHAAAIGRTFTLSFLAGLCEETADNDEIEAAVAKAISYNLLEDDAATPGALSFAHDAIREALYKNLDSIVRKSLHERIVMALESGTPEPVSDNWSGSQPVFDLAYHAIQAGDERRILVYAPPAAQRARANHAYSDALDYLRYALTALQPEERGSVRWIGITEQIGEINLIVGNYNEAIVIFQQLLPLLPSPLARSNRYAQISQAYFKKGDYARCESNGKIALSLLGETIPESPVTTGISLARELCVHIVHNLFPALLVRKKPGRQIKKYRIILRQYYTLGWSYFITDYLKLARTLIRSLNRAESEFGRSPELAFGMALYGVLCTGLNLYKRSIRYHERALELRKSLGDAWGIAQSMQYLAWCHYNNAEFDRSIDCYTESIQRFMEIGDLKEAGNSLSGKIWIHVIRGEYEAVRETNARFSVIAEKTQDDYALAYAHYFSGLYHQARGEYVAALEQLTAANERSRAHQLWIVHCLALVQLARLALSCRHDYVAARNYFSAAREIDQKHSLHPGISAPLYYEWANACADEFMENPPPDNKQRKAAIKRIGRHAHKARAMTRSSKLLRGSAERVWAIYRGLRGDNAGAKKYFERSIQSLQSIGYAVDHGRSLFAYGIFLRNRGDARNGSALIEKAHMVLSGCGNIEYLDAIEKLMGISDQPAGTETQPFFRHLKDRCKIDLIIDLIRDISLDISLKPLLDKALGGIIEITGAERGFIIIRDNDDDTDTVLAQLSVNETAPGTYSATIVRKTLTLGEPILTTNAEEEQGFSSMESIAYYDLKSILCVPILYQNNALGVCYLDNQLATAIFKPEDIETVKIIMDQLSVKLWSELHRNRADTYLVVEPTEQFCKRHGITGREQEVILLMIQGFTRKGISEKLAIAYQTVNNHIQSVYTKTGVTSKSEFIALVRKNAAHT